MEILLRYKNLIVSIAVILFFGLLGKHIFSSHQDKMAHIEEMTTILKEIEDWSLKLKKFKREYNEAKARLLKGDMFAAKKMIEEFAQIAAVEIVSYKPEKIKEYTEYKEQQISIGLEGSYERISKFIQLLETTNAIEIQTLKKEKKGGYQIIIVLLFAK